MAHRPQRSTLFPYTTLFRSRLGRLVLAGAAERRVPEAGRPPGRRPRLHPRPLVAVAARAGLDRKSTRLNSSHSQISYAVFCLKKKKQDRAIGPRRVLRTARD